MTKNSTNCGIWLRTPFCISSAGGESPPVMRNALPHSLLPCTFAVLPYGRQSRDDTYLGILDC